MRYLPLLLLLPLSVHSDTPTSEDALKARIAWLERKLRATEQKAAACLAIYNADMELNQLQQIEPRSGK